MINENTGKFRMHGGLVGKWQTTSFVELAASPIYRAKGTEVFTGCLAGGDGSCAGDPSGTLSFRFRYWAQFAEDDSLVWGSCWHPIVRGTGDFAGASGVLTFVDTPTGDGVETAYVGNVSLAGERGHRSHAGRATAASAAGCGPS